MLTLSRRLYSYAQIRMTSRTDHSIYNIFFMVFAEFMILIKTLIISYLAYLSFFKRGKIVYVRNVKSNFFLLE